MDHTSVLSALTWIKMIKNGYNDKCCGGGELSSTLSAQCNKATVTPRTRLLTHIQQVKKNVDHSLYCV